MLHTMTTHQLTENVKLLQKVILTHRENFLIVRRAPDSATRPDKWDLPGGNSEWPNATENLRDPHLADLVREVMEETGVVILPEQITRNIYVGTFFEAEKQVYTVILGWQLQLTDTFDTESVHLSDEHTEFQWISLSDFEKFDFGFAGEVDGFIRKMVERTEYLK